MPAQGIDYAPEPPGGEGSVQHLQAQLNEHQAEIDRLTALLKEKKAAEKAAAEEEEESAEGAFAPSLASPEPTMPDPAEPGLALPSDKGRSKSDAKQAR